MMRFLLSPKGRRIHRLLGLVFGLYLLAAALSGLSHNLMSAFFMPPPPARSSAAFDLASITLSPRDSVARLQGVDPASVEGVNLRIIDSKPWYQLFIRGQATPSYVRATDGLTDPHADAHHAAEIARTIFPGQTARLTARLDAYDDEYITIYRLLPVYRFDVADGKGSRVYISTVTGSAAFATTDGRQAISNFFSTVHKFNFIANKTLKLSLLTFFAGGAILTVLWGLLMWLAQRRRRGT
ncbi:hypothetical protein [Govanella unica]|uniref:PepSY domain-containing protein n=1 Tax=Govanella unica TaxID=2975056 RepID=A0A9X3TXG0_9PROT|nr:hypothetical protein [Govania unica]MDA5193448.1 hypothetical protein [Govania unica]